MTGFQQMGYFHFGTGRNIYRHRVNLFVIPPDCNSGKPTLQNGIDDGVIKQAADEASLPKREVYNAYMALKENR